MTPTSEHHRLGVQPMDDLAEHGLTMRDPRRNAVFIGVARTRNPMRQRSTLAHELGHVLFEDWADNDAGNWSSNDAFLSRCWVF
jgi:Zn-dependent peptidase ImmA (M78 family)